MASFPAVTMTIEGLNMIAKASSGNSEDRLIVTKVKFGDGVSEGNIRKYTDVISPKMEVTLAEWEDRGDGRFRYTFTYNNKGVKTGFYHREIGLFAKSGDNGGEKLIAYSNAGSYPGYIDDETKEIPYQRLMINIGVGDTDNVTGQVDVSNAVTIEILDEHNADENAHAKLIKKLFGSSEATLESVKEKVNDWAKEVCLPLSGGEMTGDITANNVYANNNVLVFNNVAEMKASNKVKAGYTLKTLGFYTAGDGGGADYVITNDIGEDEVDEASLITLKNGLYAKLLIKDFINIKWFGAYVDGEHDDSTAFNNCTEFLQRTKKEVEQIQALAVKTKVVIPHGVMKISDTIKVDINVMSLDGGGSVILAEGLEDNSYAIWVNNWTAKDGYATYTNIISQVGNFILTGTNRFDPVNGFLMGTKEAQEGSTVIGYGGARVRMERIMVQNLNTGITWGSNQYLDSWHNISVNHCHVGLDNLSSPFNTGENINFHNSVFFGNDKMYNTSLTMLFNNCSFDYNTQWFNPPVLRAWLTDCHIEGWFFNGIENSKNPFVITTGGRWCRFKMVGGDIGPVNTVHSGDVALFNVGTTAHQGVVLDNVYMDKLSSTYLINGTGVYRVNLCDYHDTNPDKIAPVCNLLGIDSFSGLTAIPKEITAGETEQISIVGDNLRVTTQSPEVGRSSIFVTVPTKDHAYIKLFLKAKLTVSSITTQGIWLSVETGYLDKDNNWVKKRGHQLNVKLDNIVANEWVTGTIGHPTNTGKEEPYVRFEITFYNMYVNATQVDVAELQVSGY